MKRVILHLSAMAFVMAFHGCICGDGVFQYDVTLTLADTAGQPVADAEFILLAASYPNYDPAQETPPTNTLERTDAAGAIATTTYSPLAWGGCMSTKQWATYVPPIPPNPEVLYLWVHGPSGAWTEYELQVPEENVVSQAPATLQIDLGTVMIAYP